MTDVLNRFPLKIEITTCPGSPSDGPQKDVKVMCDESTLRVMMYMFPRQFGLHNVFTSKVDHSKTAQRFQDYTLREEGIANKFKVAGQDKQGCKIHIPRRLRGLTVHLVQRLQVLHARCSYSQLLQHYCPVRYRQYCTHT